MKNQIALSMWSLQQLTFTQGKALDDLLDIAATLGVDGVDLGEDYLRWAPYDNLHGWNLLRRKIAALGLKTLSTWFYTDFVGAVRTASMDTTVKQASRFLAIAHQLECPFVALPPGDAWPGVRPTQGHPVMLEVFSRLVPVAQSYGVTMGLEVGRSTGPFQSPEYALRLVNEINSPYLTITPDFEAWRRETTDLPLVHVEAPGDLTPEPTPLAVFEECLPWSPLIHAKLLGFDENGEEPHFPIPELMGAINRSPLAHVVDIEYEGWIPDIRPDLDCVEQSRKCVALLRRYLT